MKRIRIGKDFAVKWSIYSKTEEGRKPYALDPENSLLRLVTPIGKEEVNGFIVEGNMLTWVFRGKAQKLIGVYALELVERNGANGMITIDTCKAFELVAHSCEESDNETGDVVIDSLVFESEVTLAPLGYSGAVEVDDQMSDVSENPVQNKVVKAYVDDTASSKQNTIADIEQIRSGATAGATAIQPEALAPYAKTQDVNTKLNAKQDVISDLATIRSGAAAGATAIQPNNLKTINGQTILGSGDITIEVNTEALATKEELETLKNGILDNEEVVAAALNDVRNYVDEQIANAVTTALNTEV